MVQSDDATELYAPRVLVADCDVAPGQAAADGLLGRVLEVGELAALLA